ncbi:MAG: ABC transporter permease [Clostridiales bacterium]|nr:ABC transporter permease [Clostridiales bacterium]
MLKQSVKMAWKSIASNKMRSFLTMLGIIIGVLALVVLVSLVSGATSSVTDSISAMGSNLIQVSILDDKDNPLKLDDIQALMDDDEIAGAAPVAQTSCTAYSTASSEEETATVYGTTGVYADIEGLELGSGRFLKNTDVDNHTNVVIINAGFAEDILGSLNVVGQTVKLDGVEYQVVGVLEADDSDSSTTETYEAYIPYTSLVRLSDNVSLEITSFYVSAASDETLDLAEEAVTNVLMERFNDDEDAFTILNMSTIMDALESITGTMTLLLGGIAGISLLLGGIGIMNIMLESLTERTREIGIRKAIGADRHTIMIQFLIEALMLSLMGCVVGIFLSWIILQFISMIGGDSLSFGLSANVVAIAVSFSIFVGVVFGIYPANKAAKKKPIDALRYIG